MTERSPIPACLSHLTQRDAAVRARALEDAACIAQVILDNVLSRPQPLSGFDAGLCLGATRARDYIRSLVPTPAASSPDTGTIVGNAALCGAAVPIPQSLEEARHFTEKLTKVMIWLLRTSRVSPYWTSDMRKGADAVVESLCHEFTIQNHIVMDCVNKPSPLAPPRTQTAVKRMSDADDAKMPDGARKSPAPDDSAIRAELIAALREVMALVPRLEHVPSRAPYAKILAVMARGRAALERAGDLP